MYDVFSDLMSLYESKRIPVTKTYEEIASEALGPSLAYATPTMHGLVLTIFAIDPATKYFHAAYFTLGSWKNEATR